MHVLIIISVVEFVMWLPAFHAFLLLAVRLSGFWAHF